MIPRHSSTTGRDGICIDHSGAYICIFPTAVSTWLNSTIQDHRSPHICGCHAARSQIPALTFRVYNRLCRDWSHLALRCPLCCYKRRRSHSGFHLLRTSCRSKSFIHTLSAGFEIIVFSIVLVLDWQSVQSRTICGSICLGLGHDVRVLPRLHAVVLLGSRQHYCWQTALVEISD
jgi:hypothetical protein